MKSDLIHWLMVGYALVLVLVGTVAFVMGTHRAVVALVGGIGGGVLVAVLSMLYRRRVLWSRAALVTAVGIFTLSFIWRAIEAQLQRQSCSAALLWGLASISVPVFVVLLRTWNR